MSEAKHTPGPWPVDTQLYLDAGFEVAKSDNRWEYPKMLQIPDEEIEANARLIAAAPELLEALEEVSQLLPCAGRLHPKDLSALMFKVIAAIAKAKGTL